MEEKELITQIGHDLYNVINALTANCIASMTDKMEVFCVEVFELDDRRGEMLDYSMDELIDILDELKPNIEKIPDHPYYRASLFRIKELYSKGYEEAESVYAEKLSALHDSVVGATSDEMANAFEALSRAIPGFNM